MRILLVLVVLLAIAVPVLAGVSQAVYVPIVSNGQMAASMLTPTPAPTACAGWPDCQPTPTPVTVIIGP